MVRAEIEPESYVLAVFSEVELREEVYDKIVGNRECEEC